MRDSLLLLVKGRSRSAGRKRQGYQYSARGLRYPNVRTLCPIQCVRGRAHEIAGVANLLANLDGQSVRVHTSFALCAPIQCAIVGSIVGTTAKC